MSSDVWAQYFESFDAYDLNGDGFITRDDLVELAARLGRPGCFNEHIEQLWKFLAASLDVDHDHRVDAHEWFEAWRELREIADSYDSFPVWFRNYCDFIFDLLDEDGDGQVLESEYERLLTVFGRQPLPGVFAALDLEGKGSLTREQLQGAIFDITCVHDEKNVRFWGHRVQPDSEMQH